MKKLTCVYCVAVCVVAGLITCNILVKAFIWTSAAPLRAEYKYSVSLIKDVCRAKYKYTTEKRQKLFDAVDNLLTPAWGILFAMIAGKLVSRGHFFDE
ncbi:MAG: hypothetical protein V1662_01055 [Candidatus Omnitrophota bacterium]